MERITGSTVSADLFGAGKDGFTNGSDGGGVPATIVTAEILNSLQEEIANVIEGVGNELNVNDRTQLKQAIQIMLSGADIIARFTTTGNITLSGLATQAGGDWSGALTAGDLIFVKDQSTGSQNGWYVAAAGAWTRAVYLDESTEVKAGNLTKVSEGVTHADSMWMLETNGLITVGVTAMVFVQKDEISDVQLSDFTGSNQSLGTNGYQKLPGGLILQWGRAGTSGSASETITFPITFPNAYLNGYATDAGSAGNFSHRVNNSTATTSQMTVNKGAGATVDDFNWFAFGY